MKVAVLTTSYPRYPGDHVAPFLADAVEHVRARGIAVDVVAPNRFRHFGIAYGAGIAGNLGARPWLAVFVPPMLAAFRRAGAAAARDADLVHAHWLPAAAVALTLRKPTVVTLHGTDVELARRAPWLARRVLRRVRAVICPSKALAEAARALGAADVDVIPHGVDVTGEVAEEARPLEILFAGRLSPEKGILELVEAFRGLDDARLVIAGDGPLRHRVPGALGWVLPDALRFLYARAAVVACPSRREGFGVVCAEAMAHGRPVVASAVGGLRDLVKHEETGLLVPPGDRAALRAALERLLGDDALRRRLGEAARRHVAHHCSWDRVTDATISVYERALASQRPR